MRSVLIGVALAVVANSYTAAQSKDWPDAIVYTGARVRVQMDVPTPFANVWWTGAALSTGRECPQVVLDSMECDPNVSWEITGCGIRMVPEPAPAYRARFRFSALRRMQVSSIYNGRSDVTGPAPQYVPGASIEGEEWLEVRLPKVLSLLPAECAGAARR